MSVVERVDGVDGYPSPEVRWREVTLLAGVVPWCRCACDQAAGDRKQGSQLRGHADHSSVEASNVPWAWNHVDTGPLEARSRTGAILLTTFC